MNRDFQSIARAIATFTLVVTEAVAYPVAGITIAHLLREEYGFHVLYLGLGGLIGLGIAVWRVLRWAQKTQ